MNRQTLSQREKLSKLERLLHPSQKAREAFRAMLVRKGRFQRAIGTEPWVEGYDLESEVNE